MKEKRSWRKIVSFCLVTLLLISLFNTANVKAEESDFEAYYSEEVADAVKETVSESESEVFLLFAEKEDVYSNMVKEVGFDSLGGAYYDEQGHLHILKKELSDIEKSNAVKSIFDQIVNQTKAKSGKAEELTEWVCLETCKYSYNELMEYKDIVCHSSCYSADEVFAVGIDDSINKINIHAIKGADLSILDTLVPKDAINIIFYGEEGEKAEFVDLESYTAYCGSAIVNDSKGTSATLSCSVGWDLSTSQPKYGYLTSGHFASSVNDMIALKVPGGQLQLGRVAKTINNGRIDAAIINKENSPAFPIISTSSTEYGTAYKFCGGVPAVNKPVTAYGAVSKIISGTVTESSYNNILANIEDMVLTSMKCEHGDSGAPVITPITTSELSLSGIVKGKVLILLQEIGTVYVKFNNIMNEWDLNGLQ